MYYFINTYDTRIHAIPMTFFLKGGSEILSALSASLQVAVSGNKHNPIPPTPHAGLLP